MSEADQGRWLTYAEAGQLLGVSAQAVRMLAKRRGWSRRTPNAYGDRARVLVPDDANVQPRSATERSTFADHMITDPNEPNGQERVNVRALEQAIEALSAQLGASREQLTIANRRIDELNAERRMLMSLLTDQARRPWWRRWFR
jgi:hypothetical protein